jgi:hypothetical protein
MDEAKTSRRRPWRESPAEQQATTVVLTEAPVDVA